QKPTTLTSRYDAPAAAIHHLRPVRPSAATSPRAGWRRLFHPTRWLTATPHRAPQTVAVADRFFRQARVPAYGAALLRGRLWPESDRVPTPVAAGFRFRLGPGPPVTHAARQDPALDGRSLRGKCIARRHTAPPSAIVRPRVRHRQQPTGDGRAARAGARRDRRNALPVPPRRDHAIPAVARAAGSSRPRPAPAHA